MVEETASAIAAGYSACVRPVSEEQEAATKVGRGGESFWEGASGDARHVQYCDDVTTGCVLSGAGLVGGGQVDVQVK